MTHNLLQLNTSLSADGESSQLASAFVQAWQAAHPDARVTTRDLAATPVPHLTKERFAAFRAPAQERSPEQREVAQGAAELIAELQAADVIVLGLPLYNFGIPSTLKAYFDHIAQPGATFSYTAKGPVGLVTNKRVFVLAARGGHYSGTEKDTQTGYVKNFLGFLGMHDVSFIYAEGLAMGPEPKRAALAAAHESIYRAAVAGSVPDNATSTAA